MDNNTNNPTPATSPAATPQTPPAPPATQTPPAATPPATPPATQTFDEILRANREYQAEFDRRVAKALQTAQAKNGDPSQMAAQLAALQKQVNDYQRGEAIMAAGVAPAFAKFVAYEVEQGLTDGTDYATALDAYLKANTQYTTQAQQQQTPPPAGWGQKQTNPPGGSADGVEAAFKALNPNLKI